MPPSTEQTAASTHASIPDLATSAPVLSSSSNPSTHARSRRSASGPHDRHPYDGYRRRRKGASLEEEKQDGVFLVKLPNGRIIIQGDLHHHPGPTPPAAIEAAFTSQTSSPRPNDLVGRQVRKHFAPFGWYTGTVMGRDDSFWQVQYEDGDIEEYSSDELEDLLVVKRRRRPEAGPAAPAASTPSSQDTDDDDRPRDLPSPPVRTTPVSSGPPPPPPPEPPVAPAAPASLEDPSSSLKETGKTGKNAKNYVGRRVEKEFTGYGIYKGTVVSKSQYWRVRYDDGDEEDYTTAQLEEILLPAEDGALTSKENTSKREKKKGRRPKEDKKFEVVDEDSSKARSSLASEPPGRKEACLVDVFCLWSLQGLKKNAKIKWKGESPLENASWCDKAMVQRMVEFFLFVYERQMIWGRARNATAATKGRTQSPILQDYFFLNVYRELDRGTAFFHQHILSLYESTQNWTKLDWITAVLWASYGYRLVNKIETFMTLGFPPWLSQTDFYEKAERYQTLKLRFFGWNPTITVDELLKGMRTVSSNQGAILKEAAANIQQATTMKEIHEAIMNLPGIVRDVAWEILYDLEESQCFHIPSSRHGAFTPAATAALEVMFPGIAASDSLSFLVDVHDAVYEALGLQFPYWSDRRLTVKEIGRCLGEFDRFKMAMQLSKTRAKRIPHMHIYTSRAYLDNSSLCQKCGQNTNRPSCETCFRFWCDDCQTQSFVGSSRICTPCRNFSSVVFAD